MINKRLVNIIFFRVYADLKAERDRGYLGYLWWFIEPIMFMAAFYIVFGLLMRRGEENFVSFLLIGLVTWKWFAGSIQQSMVSIKANKGILAQVYLPKIVFPVISFITASIKFIFIFAILSLFLFWVRGENLVSIVDLAVVILLQGFLIFSVSIFCASIVPIIPDLKLIIENLLLLVFFISGIFFNISQIPNEYQWYMQFNPMATIIKAYRDSMLYGEALVFADLIVVFFISSVILLLGLLILTKYDFEYSRLS